MERLVTGTSGKVWLKVYDEDGVLADADSAPSVEVFDGANDSVDTGTATRDSEGLYYFIIDAGITSVLDSYTVEWSYDFDGVGVVRTTEFETCGAHLFEIQDLRDRESSLQDTIRFPASKLVQARVSAEERFEEGAGVAFTARSRRVVLNGSGTPVLRLPDVEVRQIYALSVDDVDWTQEEIDEIVVDPDTGEIHHPTYIWTYGVKNISVWYEHGLMRCPQPVSQAISVLAVEYLIPTSVPSRASVQYTDGGAFRLTIAGRDGETGIPEVDAVMHAFGRVRPAVG